MLELARECDREAVARMARQVHETHVSWRPDIYCPCDDLFPEELFAQLIGKRELYVAKMDGIPVGYAQIMIRELSGIGLMPRKVMAIVQFCVDEALRNHGIGTQMMTELRILAKAFGCTDLQLSVYPQNDEAVGFYQKCGFMIQSIQMQRKV